MSNPKIDHDFKLLLKQLVACDIDGEVEVYRWQIHLINQILKCEDIRDAITIFQVDGDGNAEIIQSVLPTYLVRYDSLEESGVCPFCDHDGIDTYYEKRCRGCNEEFDYSSIGMLAHQLMRSDPPITPELYYAEYPEIGPKEETQLLADSAIEKLKEEDNATDSVS